jgi:hypothetical protein
MSTIRIATLPKHCELLQFNAAMPSVAAQGCLAVVRDSVVRGAAAAPMGQRGLD